MENSKITLYNCVLEDNQNTLYFVNKQAQLNYFNSCIVRQYIHSNFVRVTTNSVKIQETLENCLLSNYLSIDNGERIFYCFITNCEYVNHSTTLVNFKIDYLQTYLFDVSFKPCMIERMHVSNDTKGVNTQAEPISPNELSIDTNTEWAVNLDEYKVIISVTDTENISVKQYDNLLSGNAYYCFELSDETGINNLISSYARNPNAINMMYLVPKIMIGEFSGNFIPNGHQTAFLTVGEFEKYGTSLNGYIPKNNKLYTYPFNMLAIKAGSSQMNLRYEYMLDDFNIKLQGSFVYPPKFILSAQNYKGSTVNNNPYNTIVIQDFPVCSFSSDYFTTWIGQNAFSLISSTGSAISSGIVNPTMGIAPLYNMLNSVYTASNQTDNLIGRESIGRINNKIYFSRICVTAENARKIDDFFSVYGYAVNEVRLPSFNHRKNFVYLKTVNASVSGNIPQLAKQAFERFMNDGGWWWKNPTTYGNYLVENEIE